ncbi:MAG: fatty acid desaturase [Anaerolineae bacterium]|nr:fatty acid desaturase [Anaerolineae bacterium]
MLTAALAFLIAVDSYWLRLLDAVFLAFVFTQIGFMGHDLGHRQFLKTDWRRDILGLVAGNLIIGISRAWWERIH